MGLAADVSGKEDRHARGRQASGYRDLGSRLYTVPSDQIKDLKCLMTLIDGEVVYTSNDSPVTTTVR